MSVFSIGLILLIEGFAGLAFQMLFIKQLSPWLGNNVIVTSWVVGSFLLALALGYKSGGSYKKDVKKKIVNNFITASIISGFGLSFIFVDLFFTIFQNSYLIPLIIYCLIIIFPTAYILGQTVPLTTKEMPKEEVGEINGKVLFLSTIGSFLGAIITTNILLKNFGLSITLTTACIALLLSSFLIIKEKHYYFIVTFTGLTILLLNLNYEKEEYIKTTPYANYKIEEIKNLNIIAFKSNNSYSSLKYKDSNKKIGYIKEVQDILFKKLELKNKEILVIGAGGFLISEGINDNKFKYVDIDPDIKEVAEKHFLNHKINGDFIPQDGRNYINYTKENFDVIFLDAFVSLKSIPEHLATIEFFKKINTKIKKDGWLVINSIQDTKFIKPYSKNINNTISSVFKNCYIYPLKLEAELSNIIYLCKKQEMEIATIYKDNKNNSNEEYLKIKK